MNVQTIITVLSAESWIHPTELGHHWFKPGAFVTFKNAKGEVATVAEITNMEDNVPDTTKAVSAHLSSCSQFTDVWCSTASEIDRAFVGYKGRYIPCSGSPRFAAHICRRKKVEEISEAVLDLGGSEKVFTDPKKQMTYETVVMASGPLEYDGPITDKTTMSLAVDDAQLDRIKLMKLVDDTADPTTALRFNAMTTWEHGMCWQTDPLDLVTGDGSDPIKGTLTIKREGAPDQTRVVDLKITLACASRQKPRYRFNEFNMKEDDDPKWPLYNFVPSTTTAVDYKWRGSHPLHATPLPPLYNQACSEVGGLMEELEKQVEETEEGEVIHAKAAPVLAAMKAAMMERNRAEDKLVKEEGSTGAQRPRDYAKQLREAREARLARSSGSS